jgi:hypothetical protein
MTPEEMKLDMLVAELDYENRLLRARNERLEKEAEQRKPWVGLTDVQIARVVSLAGFAPDWAEAQIATQIVRTLEQQLREQNQ